jgi:hypothetical protein
MENEFKLGELVRVNEHLNDINASIIPQDCGAGIVVKQTNSLYDVLWSDGQVWMLSGAWIEKVAGQ